MKKLIISLALSLLSINSFGFEIFALGTSNTNCKGAGQAKFYLTEYRSRLVDCGLLVESSSSLVGG
jgi:hypothetical protein